MDKKVVDFVIGRVCFRNRVQKIFDSVVCVLFCANIFSVIFLSVCFCVGNPVSYPVIFVTIINLASVFAGIIFVSFKPESKIKSAIQIDQYYHLKDRILTAVQICADNKTTPMTEIQVEDAAGYLLEVEPSKVVRYRLPFVVFPMLFFMLAGYCCGLLFVSDSDSVLSVNSADVQLLPNQVSDSDKTRAILQKAADDIRASNRVNDNVNLSAPNRDRDKTPDKLFALSEQLRGEVDRGLRRLANTSTLQDSAAVLSEIEQSIKYAVNELDVNAYNFSFQAMAAAFDNADILRGTAAAIKNGDYEKAAETIESVAGEDFGSMSMLERRSVNAELSEAADGMRSRNQNELEQLTRKFADEITHGQEDNKATVDQIANQYRQQFVRNNMHADLTRRLAKIDQHKSDLLARYNTKNNSAGNEVENNSTKNNGAGNGVGDHVGGEPRGGEVAEFKERDVLPNISVTKINIAGAAGGGVSGGVEVVPDFNSVQASDFDYKNLYWQYQKKMESVLEVELIPIGRRRIIRRYFDAIKPID
ncbi:MAG: hypothetical protein LBT09_12525 [Planctomycetaceae bacterium]|jgi:ribosomal protein S17E|nr:hypothetical protein [Planctomycetaceae bacterium]